jgi:hypothetical protein
MLGYPACINHGMPIHRVGGATPRSTVSLQRRYQNVLLVIALAGLALFSLLSIVLGVEDGRESTEPNAKQYTWVRFGLR